MDDVKETGEGKEALYCAKLRTVVVGFVTRVLKPWPVSTATFSLCLVSQFLVAVLLFTAVWMKFRMSPASEVCLH